MKEQKNILAICIPTFNRGEKLCQLVKDLLTCSDQRFCVHVSDNCSTDGTINKLRKINNPRLSIVSTTTHIPAYDNYHNAIVTSPSQYALLLLDKERLNVGYITKFIDFLEYQKPNFGYLENQGGYKIETEYNSYHAGYQCVMSCGGGDNHPSGFYYLTEIYRSVTNKIETQGLWRLDLVSTYLGTIYEAKNFLQPLYVFDLKTILGGESYSKVEDDKIYFGGKQRVEDFKNFIKIVKESPVEEQRPILFALLKKHLELVTTTQRRRFADIQNCKHYGIKPKNINFFEMSFWQYKISKEFISECKSNMRMNDYYQLLKLNVRQIYICLKSSIVHIL